MPRTYTDEQKVRRAEYMRGWRDKNRASISERGRLRYLDKKDHVANLAMQRTFGITLEQYADRLASQGGVCAICGGDDPRKGSRFHIDHDRSCCPGSTSCGQCIRALLCMHCNVGLGHFRDDTDLLEAAIAYLRHHREGAAQRGSEEPLPL